MTFNALKKTVKHLMYKFNSKGLILQYHRVAEVQSDPFKLCVTPTHLGKQLEVLRNYCFPMSLQELVQSVRKGKCPDRAVALTFDDGYADNLYNAKPLLEQCDVPATVFITTGNLDRQREFWWDELERVLLQPGALPATLRLLIQGIPYEWDLGQAAHYSEENYHCDRNWSWYDSEVNDPGPRQSLYRSLYQVLRQLPSDKRQNIMDELLLWSGSEAGSRSSYRPLNSTEVPLLVQSGLIEIGAHTVTHPFLSKINEHTQNQEIQQSKSDLEEILEKPVKSFAYPHGDYTKKTTALVRSSEFNCACSQIKHPVWSRTDCFQLPRVEVQDCNGEAFYRWLSMWFGGGSR